MEYSYNWIKEYLKNAPTAESAAEVLTLKSFECEGLTNGEFGEMLSFDILPNRTSDCLGHYGIARELAAVSDEEIENPLEYVDNFEKFNEGDFKVESDDNFCKRYTTAVIEGVTVKESPKWLKDRLESIGQRSINNIVDVSNYVLFELGYPTHCFDFDHLDGSGIIVKRASDGEVYKALDECEYELSKEDYVIADSSGKTIGIAGVKGGLDSGVSEKTNKIVLEAAHFSSKYIRNTSRRLGIDSQAASNFRRPLSPYMCPVVLKRMTDLIIEVAGGEVVVRNEYNSLEKRDDIKFNVSEVLRLLGVEILVSDCVKYLTQLNIFVQSDGDELIVTPPIHRADINIKEDCIEEIARMYGLDRIINEIPIHTKPKENKQFYYKNKILDLSKELGFFENIGYALVKSGDIKLKKSIAKDKDCLRNNLSDGVKEFLDRNVLNASLVRRNEIQVIEFGKVFLGKVEKENIAVGFSGKAKKQKVLFDEWKGGMSELGIEIKGDLKDGVWEGNFEDILSGLGDPSDRGEDFVSVNTEYKEFSQFPYVVRDVSFYSNESEDVVRQFLVDNVSGLMTDIYITDEFEKDNKKSYTFRLIFQSSEKTLTDEEVNKEADVLYKALGEKGWETR